MVPVAPKPWVPDLCRLPRIAAGLGIAELVVLVIVIAPRDGRGFSLASFVAASLFALWIALIVTIALCKGKPWIDRLPRFVGLTVALALPMTVASIGALFVHQVDVGLRTGLSVPMHDATRFIASIATLTGLITAVALRYFYMREQWQEQLQAQAKAQVDALQARIRPHFLFNSMNTIASLVRRDPATAERAVEDLADLFRAALGAGEGDATLADEITLAKRYLSIEGLRLGERLRVHWDLVEPLPYTLRLPRLVLQPLLENAVGHGIARLPAGGEIHVRITADARSLRIRITNPALPPRERDAGNRHALDSIAQRLAYHFGPGAALTRGFDDGYYVCEIVLPLSAPKPSA